MEDKRCIIVYISGKYSGTSDEISANIKLAREYSIKVWEYGFTALCPHLNTQNFEVDCNCVYDDYIDGDLHLVDRCDGVLMLPGWKDSNGARIERSHALKMGFPVFDDWENFIRYEWYRK